MSSGELPIRRIERRFRDALAAGPVVVSAPTGSGKSTVVPLWCADGGRALVVEPRRVACRSLARWVAAGLGTPLGADVGYVVRHDDQTSRHTRITYATPGIALRMIEEGAHRRYGVVVLDEFHERSLDVDLLLALLHREPRLSLVVMSATLQAERLAGFLGATAVHAEGRLHPVTVEYSGDPLLPSDRGLDRRVVEAVERVAGRDGDILVFLPGKAEIGACSAALGRRSDLDVIPLHAQLPARDQDRAFEPGERRRVILATNVAETSVTLPRIGVIIDSGLVRQTRYRGTRGYLTLVPIALDSAEQRRGRAGRLFPGHCLRLWSEAARLEEVTAPEIHRQALPAVVLATAACGLKVDNLAFLDPPKPYAVATAEQELRAMGALDAEGGITDLGRRLFSLPVDAHLGRILLVAEQSPHLQEAIDLVAALAVGRPLFRPGPRPLDEQDDLRAAGCDATAFVRALRHGKPERHGLNAAALAEARRIAEQLRGLLRVGPPSPQQGVDRQGLARLILKAHPTSAYLPRRRKKYVAWANGEVELELGRCTAVKEEAEALVVVDTRALTVKRRKTIQMITAALPCTVASLRAAGLGEVKVGQVRLHRGVLVAEAIRSYAGVVLEREEVEPTGELARHAAVRLALAGKLFPEALATTRERVAAHNLYARLEGGGERVELEEWLASRFEELELQSGADLELLLPDDLRFPDLPEEQRAWLDRGYPREVSVGDGHYRVDYDERAMEATLVKTGGSRTTLPPLAYLPQWPGWRLLHRDRSVVRVLRERR